MAEAIRSETAVGNEVDTLPVGQASLGGRKQDPAVLLAFWEARARGENIKSAGEVPLEDVLAPRATAGGRIVSEQNLHLLQERAAQVGIVPDSLLGLGWADVEKMLGLTAVSIGRNRVRAHRALNGQLA